MQKYLLSNSPKMKKITRSMDNSYSLGMGDGHGDGPGVGTLSMAYFAYICRQISCKARAVRAGYATHHFVFLLLITAFLVEG